MGDFVRFDDRELDLLFKGPDGPVGKMLAKMTIRTVRISKRLCPVDTGRLRSSIASEMGGDSQGMVARVGTNVEYARHVEFGTRRMRPRSFLRAALNDAVNVAWANGSGSGTNTIGYVVDTSS